ncbi:SnoaL-like domain-containing protein [Micromonospora haikouensis]|uniref:SnoaL-like domain-containing protein n=1 Tax=Micromonospora haikouensis TaxID=686309 RepID=A0A1C4WUC1_9ACTN|nr:nuclear transport factor 2 family protein [Micromonospora haikouensis]SCE99743.1 SnoaL-like domain-containing protein [Micromonospora haikouensis]
MTTSDQPDVADLLRRLYASFNARDIDEIVAVLSPRVDWPNMIDGVRLVGPAEVGRYWRRQFDTIDPRVEPRAIVAEPDGRVRVEVHQVVRSLDGEVLADQLVQHVYTIRGGLVERMDVRESA